MKHNEILESLSSAKESHLLWLDHGMEIFKGEDLLHVQQPVSCTDCNFGLWFYAKADSLRTLAGFKEIELLHAEFHHKYDILFTHAHEAHRPRLFGKKKLRQKLNKDYLALEKKSVFLLQKLEEVEKLIYAEMKAETAQSMAS